VAAVSSFTAVADEWLRKVEKEGRSAVTLMKLRWLLGFFKTAIGKRPVAAISAHELLMMLRKMEAKGCYETAKRLRSTCSQVFRYANRHGARRARRRGGSARGADRTQAGAPRRHCLAEGSGRAASRHRNQ
jgi:hypothetical protein